MANEASDTETAARILSQGLTQMDLAADQLAPPLLVYLKLLRQWNRVHNLTAVDDLNDMVARHGLDSLSVTRWLPSGRILDIGTGAGLPGIPLALACPDNRFVLLDARDKKLRFVRHACRELGLQNIETVHARLEDYRPQRGFNGVIARAFADWRRLAELARAILAPGGFLLAMAGRVEPDAKLTAPPGFDSAECIRLQVPFLRADRHLILLRRDS